MGTQKKREMFDAEEYAQKMDEMIANLRKRTPGEPVGKVGKNDILAMRREALQKLIEDGYTVNQIAAAIQDDVFKILPKTITEIVNSNKPKVAAKKPRKSFAAKESAASTGRDADAAKKQGAQDATAKTTVGDVGSISVTEDSEDL